jgi:hypothetical protein
MRSGASESFLLYVTVGLEIILAVLVLRRRGFQNLPFFTFYVFLITLQGLFLWAVYRWLGYMSRPAFFAYWSSQTILLLSRGAVCAELCWQVLRKRPKLFWTLARDLFVTVGAGIVLYTAFDSIQKIIQLQRPSFVLAIERGFALAVAVVLICLMGVARRYSIRIQRGPLLIAAGLCFYSLVQTVNDTFLDWLRGKFSWWNDFHIVAFQVALLLWIWAFVTQDSDVHDKPVPIVPWSYAEQVVEVSRKLRSMEEELEETARK